MSQHDTATVQQLRQRLAETGADLAALESERAAAELRLRHTQQELRAVAAALAALSDQLHAVADLLEPYGIRNCLVRAINDNPR